MEDGLKWCTKERCEEVLSLQVSRGLSFKADIIAASEDGKLPNAPEWAHIIRYRKAD